MSPDIKAIMSKNRTLRNIYIYIVSMVEQQHLTPGNTILVVIINDKISNVTDEIV